VCVKEAVWHGASAALPGGQYSLVFEATCSAQWSADNLALDNIQVDDAPCNFCQFQSLVGNACRSLWLSQK